MGGGKLRERDFLIPSMKIALFFLHIQTMHVFVFKKLQKSIVVKKIPKTITINNLLSFYVSLYGMENVSWTVSGSTQSIYLRWHSQAPFGNKVGNPLLRQNKAVKRDGMNLLKNENYVNTWIMAFFFLQLGTYFINSQRVLSMPSSTPQTTSLTASDNSNPPLQGYKDGQWMSYHCDPGQSHLGHNGIFQVHMQ